MTSDKLSFAAEFPNITEQDWRSLVDKAVQGRDFDKVMTKKSYNDLTIQGLYSQTGVTQGAQPTSMSKGWSICVPHWNSDTAKTNKAILEDLMGGATAIGLRFQAGHFPGLKSADLGSILDGVYPDMVAVNLLPGEAFVEVSKAYNAYLKSAKSYDGAAIDPSKLTGTFGCDPIGVLAQTGRLAHTVEDALRYSATLAQDVSASNNQMRTFTVSTGIYHTAGATEAQELGFMLSTALSYLRAMEEAGMSLAEAAQQIQFTIIADADIYLTIAKCRAARRLWAELLAHCGVDSSEMKLTAMGALRMMTVVDPWVNILRSTAACFAAGVGGADEITLLPHDMMVGMSSSFARRIARNVQIILQEESNLGQVIDPAHGSYALETLTEDLTKAAWKEFQTVEQLGGVVEGLKLGQIQAMIEESWQSRQKNLATRRDAVTGVSEFPDIHEKPITNVDLQDGYIMEAIEAAIEVAPLPFHRLSEDFEAMRAASDTQLAKTGKRPQMFMANLGTVADHTARATFAKNFFEAGGIETLPTKGFTDIAALTEAFKDTGAKAAVICGTDAAYDTGELDIVAALKSAGASLVYIAGKRPTKEALLEAGLTDCIFMGANLLEVLSTALGVLLTEAGDAS